MLKIIDTINYNNTIVDIDSDILRVEVAERDSQRFFWRPRHEGNPILEVAILTREKNGHVFAIIQGFDLILLSQPIICSPVSFVHNEIENVQGIPVCDLSNWPKESYHIGEPAYYFEEPWEIQMFHGNKVLSIMWGAKNKVKKTYSADRVKFGVDKDNYLCSLHITEFTQNELEILSGRSVE